MLVYALYVAVIALVILAAWYTWYRLQGRRPPDVEADKAPPPDHRDERWDPRRRYQDSGDGDAPGEPS